MNQRDEQKRRAAERAVGEVQNGMVLGLGSGTTVAFALEALARRVLAGLQVTGIPSSAQTAAEARRLGIKLTDFATHRGIDLTIDGADQIERGTLNLVKGLGGALLREKMIALASARMIVIADDAKLVDRLGAATPVPVEIVPFGSETTLDRLAESGASPRLRVQGGQPFVTDNGNYIADCAFAEVIDGAALDATLRSVYGVVATGLFVGIATEAMIGMAAGAVITLRRA